MRHDEHLWIRRSRQVKEKQAHGLYRNHQCILHSSAYPSLPKGAKCNNHSDEDKRVRDIKHRPDSKVDKVHDSSSSQYIQEIAGGAADGSAEP